MCQHDGFLQFLKAPRGYTGFILINGAIENRSKHDKSHALLIV